MLLQYGMQLQAERAYLLAHFQEYRIIQPTVIFLHGLPTALSRKQTLANQLQRVGRAHRITLQPAAKDFFTAFVEFEGEAAAAVAIMALDGRQLMNRTLRVFYGSTKFCPHFLRGHGCRLQECNYAHYYHPALTHLKQHAKDIDHHAIAALFLNQHHPQTELLLTNLDQPQPQHHKFLLPIDSQALRRQLIPQHHPETEEQEPESQSEAETREQAVVVGCEWGALSAQIESELRIPGEEQSKRTRIQLFLEGAERFLSKLIFQSSGFVL